MARLPNQKAREIYQWDARTTTSLHSPKKVAEAASVWNSQGLGEAPDTDLFFFPFHLCCLDLRNVVLLHWQLIRATENANYSKLTGNKPPNTFLCITLRKCSVHLSLNFPLREMGMMPGVGGIS